MRRKAPLDQPLVEIPRPRRIPTIIRVFLLRASMDRHRLITPTSTIHHTRRHSEEMSITWGRPRLTIGLGVNMDTIMKEGRILTRLLPLFQLTIEGRADNRPHSPMMLDLWGPIGSRILPYDARRYLIYVPNVPSRRRLAPRPVPKLPPKRMHAMEQPVRVKLNRPIAKKSRPWDALAKRPNVLNCIVNVSRSEFTVVQIVVAWSAKIP